MNMIDSTFNRRMIRSMAILAVIISLPVIFLLWIAVFPIISDLRIANADSSLAQHLWNLAYEKPAYQAALSKAQTSLSTRLFLYDRADAELESADLQNSIQQILQLNRGVVSSSSIDETQSVHGINVLSISVIFNVPSGELPAIMTAFDAANPKMVINRLDIRGDQNFGTTSGQLQIQMQVISYGLEH